MKGCLNGCFVFVAGFFLLLLFFQAPVATAIVAGVLAMVVGLTRRQKRKTQRRQQKLRQKALEEERLKAIAAARKRSDLFKYNSHTGLADVEKLQKQGNLSKWAAAIQTRYQGAKSSASDALLVINDDIAQLVAYRQTLMQGLIQDCDRILSPFKGDLERLESTSQKTKTLRLAEKFVFPDEMQPAVVQKRLETIASTVGRNAGMGINQYFNSRGGYSNFQRKDALFIGIHLASAVFSHYRAHLEERNHITHLQGEVDLYCNQIAGLVSSLGMTNAYLKSLYQEHQKVEMTLRESFGGVETLVQGKQSLDDCDEDQIDRLEEFYFRRKQLVQLMEINICKS